jgi:hypothetical protein
MGQRRIHAVLFQIVFDYTHQIMVNLGAIANVDVSLNDKINGQEKTKSQKNHHNPSLGHDFKYWSRNMLSNGSGRFTGGGILGH